MQKRFRWPEAQFRSKFEGLIQNLYPDPLGRIPRPSKVGCGEDVPTDEQIFSKLLTFANVTKAKHNRMSSNLLRRPLSKLNGLRST
jgi:hypothetical protein